MTPPGWRHALTTDHLIGPNGERVSRQAVVAARPLLATYLQGDFARGQRRRPQSITVGTFADGGIRYSA